MNDMREIQKERVFLTRRGLHWTTTYSTVANEKRLFFTVDLFTRAIFHNQNRSFVIVRKYMVTKAGCLP